MAEVRLKDVNKIYQGKTPVKKAWWEFWKAGSVPSQVHIVKGANLEIKDGEFMVLVGPSGCGKSTTLRMIAGLEEASSGEILIGDRVVNDVSPKERDIAMVFQSYALYPHMNVRDNMAFGLKLRKYPPAEIDRMVNEAAELLGLQQLLLRKPKELSGGQRQRVAMGRAIVRRPKVYLMDEPLSNLDAKLRVQMRAELQKLHRKLGVTTVYVTHDQTEAMTLGDRIVIMKDGLIQQVDSPLNLYEKPNNKYVAGFIGSPSMNFLPVTLQENFTVAAAGFRFEAPAEQHAALAPYKGQPMTLGVRPQDIHEESGARPGAPLARIQTLVEVVEPLGSENYLYGNSGGDPFVARVNAHCPAKVGDTLELVFDLRRYHLFDAGTEQAVCHSRPLEDS